jgi:hypothetical protein
LARTNRILFFRFIAAKKRSLGDRLDGDSGVEGEAIGMSRYKG